MKFVAPTWCTLVKLSPWQTAKGKLSPWARKSGVLTSQWEIHVRIISQWAHLTFVNDATQTCRWCFSNELPGERDWLLATLEKKEEHTLNQGEKVKIKGTYCPDHFTSKTQRVLCMFCWVTVFVQMYAPSKRIQCLAPNSRVCCWYASMFSFVCSSVHGFFFSSPTSKQRVEVGEGEY